MIYRSATQKRDGIVAFFLRKLPQLFRETWRYTAVSFAISAIFCILSFQMVQSNPSIVSDVFGGGMDQEIYGQKTAGDIMDRFRNVPSPLLATLVTTNNIHVAFLAFALGITFGVGTVYVLATNGVMLGAIAGAFAQNGMGTVLWRTILIHGALELSAIVLAGAAGLIIGQSLWCPGSKTRRLALRDSAQQASLLVAGLVPAFLIAGFFEGFVTPSDAVSEPIKMSVGCAVALCYWLYLCLSGRQVDAEDTSANRARGPLI